MALRPEKLGSPMSIRRGFGLERPTYHGTARVERSGSALKNHHDRRRQRFRDRPPVEGPLDDLDALVDIDGVDRALGILRRQRARANRAVEARSGAAADVEVIRASRSSNRRRRCRLFSRAFDFLAPLHSSSVLEFHADRPPFHLFFRPFLNGAVASFP